MSAFQGESFEISQEELVDNVNSMNISSESPVSMPIVVIVVGKL